MTRRLDPLLDAALELAGRAAYHRPGASAAPWSDPDVQAAVERLAEEVGDGTMQAVCGPWTRGWEAERDAAAQAVLDAP